MATHSIKAMTIEPFMATTYMREALEAANQTFLIGAVLVSSSGLLAEGGADPTDIVGIALKAGNNAAASATNKSHYSPLLPGTIIKANLAQAAADTVFAQATHLWARFGLVKRSSGTAHWVIDSAETTAANVRVCIIGLAENAVNGDTNAPVHAVVLGPATATSLTRATVWV